jgi:zinc transport system permease protein
MNAAIITDIFKTVFSYGFVFRAMLVGVLISVCAALLGVSLVLRRCSMIGDGLSHVGFGALAVAAALGAAQLWVALPVVVVVAFLIIRLGDDSKLSSDSAIALLSSGVLALGVMIVSLTGSNTNLSDFLFGSVFALGEADAILSLVLSVIVLALFVLFYNKIFAVTFDAAFARATGTREGFYNTFIALLTAVTVVVGMRLVGALLVTSLIIFPPLTAMRVCKKFRSVVICSGVLSALSFVIGMMISLGVRSAPVGASVVLVNVVFFLLFLCAGKVRSMIRTRTDGGRDGTDPQPGDRGQ